MGGLCMSFPPNYKDNASLASSRWRAMLPRSDNLIKTAAYKLTPAEVGGFKATDEHHVFSVLSQRLCLDLVLATAEAAQLAVRSVSHHMRLLTGLSVGNSMLYTHSPSEPILALSAAWLLYNPHQREGRFIVLLDTFRRNFGLVGLISKVSIEQFVACFLSL